jgi:hypothetical protein
MPRFRKKPIEIEAREIVSYLFLPEIDHWIRYNGGKSAYGQQDGGPAELLISTPEGVMTGSVGDWIIRGVNGEFYPCKPDIFKKTYELVEE